MGKPSIAVPRSCSTGCPDGAGLRASATAVPIASPNRTISTAVTRAKTRRSPRRSAGMLARRCHQPTAASPSSTAVLSSTSCPYRWPTRSAGLVRRTAADTSPEPATRTRQTVATTEKRRTATAMPVGSPRSVTASASSPPTHRVTGTACSSMAETASWWSPAEEAWPVKTVGITASTATRNAVSAPPGLSVNRQMTNTVTASAEVNSSDWPSVIEVAKSTTAAYDSSPSGRPARSDRVYARLASAQTAQPSAVQPAARSRRQAVADNSFPLRGDRNTAASSSPTVAAANSCRPS